MSDIAYIERVKIQSEILLPFYKRLCGEIGKEKTKALLRAAVQDYAEKVGESIRDSNNGTSLDKLRQAVPMFTAANALDVEPLADSSEELSMNVTRCAYSEYFHQLGEAEFGAMLTCEVDPPMTRAIGDDLSLERNETLMSGGSKCDFRWRLKA